MTLEEAAEEWAKAKTADRTYHDGHDEILCLQAFKAGWTARDQQVRELTEMQKVHLQTGSKDDYGLGMYNGIEFAISILTKQDPKYLTLDELKDEVQG